MFMKVSLQIIPLHLSNYLEHTGPMLDVYHLLKNSYENFVLYNYFY